MTKSNAAENAKLGDETAQRSTRTDLAVISGYRGVLVIGDPCLGSRRRVGRVDDHWAAAFSKLERAIEIANERQLLPIITGDLLHESRDIGQLLPIINLFHKNKVILLPRNARWQERSEGHIAAILNASDISRIAGHSAMRFKLAIQEKGDLKNLELHCCTSWGGVKPLEMGTPAYIKIPDMDLTIMQSSGLPVIEGAEDGDTRIVGGRLLRLSPAEEAMEISVVEITLEGIERIPLDVTPIVFSSSSEAAYEAKSILSRDSKFVDRLREAATESLEEQGKESLIELADAACDTHKRDDYIRSKIIALVKQVGEEP